MDTKKLNSIVLARGRKTVKEDPYHDEIVEIRRRFLEHNIDLHEKSYWRLINSHLSTTEYGWNSFRRLGLVREFISEFGLTSGYWEVLAATKKEREFYKRRLAYLVYNIRETIAQKKGSVKTRRVLGRFLAAALKMHCALNARELTEAQKKYMFRIEQTLGIYYTDLSPEDNGEIWRFEEKTN